MVYPMIIPVFTMFHSYQQLTTGPSSRRKARGRHWSHQDEARQGAGHGPVRRTQAALGASHSKKPRTGWFLPMKIEIPAAIIWRFNV